MQPVEKLLINVCSRGLYDHLEGGIARYTVDDLWVVPHFENMLYDNVLFVELLTKFYQNNKETYFKEKLIQTINFVHSRFVNEENLNLYGIHAKSALEANAGRYVARGSKISKL